MSILKTRKKLWFLTLFCILFILFLIPPQQIHAESTDTVYSDTSGINSWWVYPLSVKHKGKYSKTYTSYTSKNGYSGLIEKNNKTGKIRRVNIDKTSIDDHNAGAVEVLKDGRLLYVTTGHSRNKYLKIFISKNPEDISSWNRPIKLKTPGTTTYAQILKTQKGYYLFTRLHYSSVQTPLGDPARWTWAVSYSPTGKTWSPLHNIINGTTNKYYLKAMLCQDSTDIRLIMYSNPNRNQSDIRLAFYSPTTSTVQDEDGNILYTLSKNGTGALFTEIPTIIAKGDNSQRLLDVGYTKKDTTAIAYGTFTNTKDAQYKYTFYANKELVTYNLAKAGRAFFNSAHYIGGIAISENSPSTIYLSRNKGKWWFIEKWMLKNNSFYKVATLKKSSKKLLIRPFIIKYMKDTVYWSEGKYNRNSYNKFNTKINTK